MIRIHHINVTAPEPYMATVAEFYRDVLGLPEFTNQRRAEMVGALAAASPARHLGEVDLEVHIAKLSPFYQLPYDPERMYRLNPTERGHVAFRTDELDGVKERLRAAKIPYINTGQTGVPTWTQIFTKDPMGNTIEIQQVVSGDEVVSGPDVEGVSIFPEE